MLDKPMPFNEALAKLKSRIPTGSSFDSKTWAALEADVRERAFFSATVEDRLTLARFKRLILNFLKRNRDDDGKLKVGGIAEYVREAVKIAEKEGLGKIGVPDDMVDQNDITDLRSEIRQRLIFNTNVSTSYGFGSWRQGMEPSVLKAYPAQRVVRNPGAVDPRPRHVAEEGTVRLKTDEAFWAGWMNDPAIGGFGVSWPQFGFNSYIDVEDVDRDQAEKLGLVVDSLRENSATAKKRRYLNWKSRLSIRTLEKLDIDRLKADLEGLAKFSNGSVRILSKEERT